MDQTIPVDGGMATTRSYQNTFRKDGGSYARRREAMCALRACGLLDVHEPLWNAANKGQRAFKRSGSCKAREAAAYWWYVRPRGTRQMPLRDRVRLGLYSLISDLLVCKPLTPAR